MEDALIVAAYIARRYQGLFNEAIEEMKLHRLMYFAQRESFIQNNEPLFDATFYGWKYGPVLKEIRRIYCTNGSFNPYIYPEIILSPKEICVFDKLFMNYAPKKSTSLNTLSHGEISWQNSRKGISQYDDSDNPMDTEDIRKDAENMRARRRMLEEYRKKNTLQ